MASQVIRHSALAVSRWRNGAGRKVDIATGPDWLVGYAWLDEDAAFSDYAGHDRTIILVDGPGFALDFAGRVLAVDKPYAPAAFDGGDACDCRIPGGPCMVLNAMTARAAWRHSVRIAIGPQRLERGDAAALLAVVLRGSAEAEGETLQRLDALRVDGIATLQPSADAIVYLVRIDPA